MEKKSNKTRNVILLVILGIAIYKIRKMLAKYKKDSDVFLFFSGTKRKYKVKPFQDTKITAIFSGAELDLQEAKIENETATLEIKGRFSGFSIKVNPSWNVKVEGTEKKSGISNNTKYDENEPPQLIIKYDLKFSGMEVK